MGALNTKCANCRFIGLCPETCQESLFCPKTKFPKVKKNKPKKMKVLFIAPNLERRLYAMIEN
jgi:sulfatase maturation enzyme AslB (radical SAM superfamily)